ncbi:MAG: ABC transporter ATP-binding protein [Gracilimonas sp.]|nr:ABC transporter ATP-binding protein [Gracilimonas sp.]
MISLSAERLSKKFNSKTVFEGITIEHQHGVLGISGSNGSGKSTLLKCLAYLLRPNSGSIVWKNNEHLMNQSQVKEHIGYVAPYINLYAELTIVENLAFLLEAGGNYADSGNISTLLERVQLTKLSNQLFGSLSTGQQQRAKLAAALVHKPKILMMDEPGSNLDEVGHKMVRSIVETEAEKGTLIFLASNDPNEISLCKRVINMTI